MEVEICRGLNTGRWSRSGATGFGMAIMASRDDVVLLKHLIISLQLAHLQSVHDLL